MNCDACGAEVLDIDVRCGECGAILGATGAHRMLGQVMLGQYELVDVLGQGGMSVVFKGKHKLTDQEVALKILPPELAANKEVKSRFLDEAKALAALDHPNIVHLYNFGQENGFFVLAMQFVQGQTWERKILESTKLPWAESCRIAADVLRALEYAHGRGVVHRDMKPSNVLVRANDGVATVMDFGIAKMATSTRLTATGQTMGTVRYMSPEQVRGQDVDLRTDIYSLGATLYESLVGDTPFDGNTHFEIMTKHLSEVPKRPSLRGVTLPLDVEDALMRSLAKKPDDRFANAREMRRIIEAALKAGDVGLIETQRMGRDVVDQLPPRSAATVSTDPAAVQLARSLSGNETELADALEPGTSGRVRRKRSVLPWILLALLIVGGGITAALILLNRGGPHTPTLAGVPLVKQGTFGDLSVQTDGRLEPAEVAALYRSSWSDMSAQFQAGKPPFEITDRVKEIVALPASALCDKSLYLGTEPPQDCLTTLATISLNNARQVRAYVVSDRAHLTKAIRTAIATAVCYFDAEFAKDMKAGDLCDRADALVETRVR